MITADVQQLTPGRLIDLYEIRLDLIGGQAIRIHPYRTNVGITFQGRQYDPWAIQIEGLERTGSLQQPSPTVTVGNIAEVEGAIIPGFVSALCLAYDDLAGVQFVRRRTLVKYLDGQPDANPNEHMPDEIWFIEQKISETKSEIKFRLATALDFSQRQLPSRQIIQNLCLWKLKGGYRGPYCAYTGSAMFDADGNPTSDPTKDFCPGRLQDCKKRFAAEQGVSENAAIINFGGFPSARKVY